MATHGVNRGAVKRRWDGFNGAPPHSTCHDRVNVWREDVFVGPPLAAGSGRTEAANIPGRQLVQHDEC